MKKYLLFLFCLFSVLLLTACNGNSNNANNSDLYLLDIVKTEDTQVIENESNDKNAKAKKNSKTNKTEEKFLNIEFQGYEKANKIMIEESLDTVTLVIVNKNRLSFNDLVIEDSVLGTQVVYNSLNGCYDTTILDADLQLWITKIVLFYNPDDSFSPVIGEAFGFSIVDITFISPAGFESVDIPEDSIRGINYTMTSYAVYSMDANSGRIIDKVVYMEDGSIKEDYNCDVVPTISDNQLSFDGKTITCTIDNRLDVYVTYGGASITYKTGVLLMVNSDFEKTIVSDNLVEYKCDDKAKWKEHNAINIIIVQSFHGYIYHNWTKSYL